MEIIPFLIFAFIAFKVFSGFTKTASGAGESAKTMMQRMHKELEKAERLKGGTSQQRRDRESRPTQRGRERLQSKGKSPWGENGTTSSGARVAANYLQRSQLSRKQARRESHKNPEQYGRRGRNVDQNRNRTNEWGQRGDGGLFSGKMAIILLVIGGAVLYVLSQMPAS